MSEDRVKLRNGEGVRTCQADEQASEQHLTAAPPGLWQAGAQRGQQDLRRHEELDGETDEHAKRVQDLHQLIGPGEGGGAKRLGIDDIR